MSIANGVVVCDNYDKVILVNNTALKMLNLIAKDLISTRIFDYCDSDGKMCFHNELTKFKETPLEEIESRPLECQIIINGKVIKSFISPIFTLHQEYLGYILVLHDVTKEAEIEQD